MAEVLVDTDDKDEPPGLINIPDDELPAAPSTSAAAAPDSLLQWRMDEHVMLNGWTRMSQPFSAEQMAMIHATEMNHYINMLPMRHINDEAHADVQWQQMLQACSECVPEMESSCESDLDELLGLFRLHISESCLATAKKYTLWLHTRTYVQCQAICPDAVEGKLYLCEVLPDAEWVTAEGLINITFTKYRWAHIDNDTEHVFDLGIGTEVGKLRPVDQELSIEELNQLTAKPVEAEIDQLDVNSEQIPKLMIPE